MRQVREMSRMATEMAEQPLALTALIERRGEIEAAVAAVAPRQLAGTVLVARGSSDHAAAGGRYLLEMASGRPTALGSPSITSRYGAKVDFSGYLVIALSQSGQTPEIAVYLERARAAGAVGIAITNDASSPLSGAADLTIDLATGPERAVPATKTVTAEMLALIMVAGALGGEPVDPDRLEALPAQVEAVLADQGPAAAVAAQLAGADRILTVARGILQGAALETALKIEEITGKMVASHSAADFLHGPIAIAAADLPVIAFDSPGPTHPDVAGLVEKLRVRGCAVHVAGPEPSAELPWPAAPEALAPILGVVRGQQVASSLAALLGVDPDRPAGLTKVTVT
jgi:glutamine---fructose-6-phosphate transaminase (isomerizing)